MTQTLRPRLTESERAHLRIVRQEAKRRRLEHLIERRINERADIAACMEGEAYYAPSVLRNTWDRWELEALTEMNACRPRWRLCMQLPPERYLAKYCNCYGDCT